MKTSFTFFAVVLLISNLDNLGTRLLDMNSSLQTSDMKYLLLATLAVLLFVQAMAAVPYPPPLDRNLSEDYNDNNLENFLGRADKRACIPRGRGCDGKPNDCCANSSCRCNLWGTNCRCERAGLFQQWGK
ncbi:hypothetical protein AVEN_89129-1 [Araneus ventricosus]|uniref:U8-agatoxin-Ao1a n=1 Tax=Araneus ventricosus TaxID=182803 RepID=A0A4Y2B2M7_ARAVE|nr:hypothetical protein AVEN_89129-1 [Araneus ventricosus]